MADMSAKGRQRTSPMFGEQNAMTKLTAEIVAIIRKTRGTQKEIAEICGVGQAHVSRIKHGICWSHIAASVDDIKPEKDRPSLRPKCRRGHLLTETNIRIAKKRDFDRRVCLQCARIREKRRPRRKGTVPLAEWRPTNRMLTAESVMAARDRARMGESMRSLAKAYGVSYTSIRLAIKGETWKHAVEDAKVRA